MNSFKSEIPVWLQDSPIKPMSENIRRFRSKDKVLGYNNKDIASNNLKSKLSTTNSSELPGIQPNGRFTSTKIRDTFSNITVRNII